MPKSIKGASAPVSKPDLKLVPITPIRKPSRGTDRVHQDIIDDLRYLLRKAEHGELVGFGFVGMFSAGYSDMDVSGEVKKNPLFAAGLLTSLKYKIMKEMHLELDKP